MIAILTMPVVDTSSDAEAAEELSGLHNIYPPPVFSTGDGRFRTLENAEIGSSETALVLHGNAPIERI